MVFLNPFDSSKESVHLFVDVQPTSDTTPNGFDKSTSKKEMRNGFRMYPAKDTTIIIILEKPFFLSVEFTM